MRGATCSASAGSRAKDGPFASDLYPRSGVLPSAAYDIDHCKNHNPYNIHKMPVESDHFAPFVMFAAELSRQAENRYHGKSDKPGNNVRAVQAYQRIECCAEKI